MATKRYELNDEQWEQIKDMFPKAKTGRPPKDNRLMFNAILWLARSGAAWADIPERFHIKLFTVVSASGETMIHY